MKTIAAGALLIIFITAFLPGCKTQPVSHTPSEASAGFVASPERLVSGAACYMRLRLAVTNQLLTFLAMTSGQGEVVDEMYKEFVDSFGIDLEALGAKRVQLGMGDDTVLVASGPVFRPDELQALKHLLQMDYLHLDDTAIRAAMARIPPIRLHLALNVNDLARLISGLQSFGREAKWSSAGLDDPQAVERLLPAPLAGESKAQAVQALQAAGVKQILAGPADAMLKWFATFRSHEGWVEIEMLVASLGSFDSGVMLLVPQDQPIDADMQKRLEKSGFWQSDAASLCDPVLDLRDSQVVGLVRAVSAVSFADPDARLRLLAEGVRDINSLERWREIRRAAFEDFAVLGGFSGNRLKLTLRWTLTAAGQEAMEAAGLASQGQLADYLTAERWASTAQKLRSVLPAEGPLAGDREAVMKFIESMGLDKFALRYYWPQILANPHLGPEKILGTDGARMMAHQAKARDQSGNSGLSWGDLPVRFAVTPGSLQIGTEMEFDLGKLQAVQQAEKASECSRIIDGVNFVDPPERLMLFVQGCHAPCPYSFGGPGSQSEILRNIDQSKGCGLFCTAQARQVFAKAEPVEQWMTLAESCPQDSFGLPKDQPYLMSYEWFLLQWLKEHLADFQAEGPDRKPKPQSAPIQFPLPVPPAIKGLYRLPVSASPALRYLSSPMLVVSASGLRIWQMPTADLSAGAIKVNSVTENGLPGQPIGAKDIRARLPADAPVAVLADRDLTVKRLGDLGSDLPAAGVRLGLFSRQGVVLSHSVLLQTGAGAKPQTSIRIAVGRRGYKLLLPGQATPLTIPKREGAWDVAGMVKALKSQLNPEKGSATVLISCEVQVKIADLVQLLDALAEAGLQVAGLAT